MIRPSAARATAVLDERAPTVLVADDDDDIRDLIAFVLENAGYDVITADTGTAALHAVETRLPDAIVLDISMPGMDGYAVCYRLQQLRKIVDIPTIIVSSRSQPTDIELAFTVGADEYLPKPVQPAQLIQRLRWLLSANLTPRRAA